MKLVSEEEKSLKEVKIETISISKNQSSNKKPIPRFLMSFQNSAKESNDHEHNSNQDINKNSTINKIQENRIHLSLAQSKLKKASNKGFSSLNPFNESNKNYSNRGLLKEGNECKNDFTSEENFDNKFTSNNNTDEIKLDLEKKSKLKMIEENHINKNENGNVNQNLIDTIFSENIRENHIVNINKASNVNGYHSGNTGKYEKFEQFNLKNFMSFDNNPSNPHNLGIFNQKNFNFAFNSNNKNLEGKNKSNLIKLSEMKNNNNSKLINIRDKISQSPDRIMKKDILNNINNLNLNAIKNPSLNDISINNPTYEGFKSSINPKYNLNNNLCQEKNENIYNNSNKNESEREYLHSENSNFLCSKDNTPDKHTTNAFIFEDLERKNEVTKLKRVEMEGNNTDNKNTNNPNSFSSTHLPYIGKHSLNNNTFTKSESLYFKNDFTLANHFRKLIQLKNVCDSASGDDDENNTAYMKSFMDFSSPFRYYWGLLVILICIYFCTYGVLRIAFFTVYDLNNFFSYFEIIVDLIFILDLIFQFYSPFIEKKKIIYGKKQIAMRYLFSWFFADLIAAMPFNTFFMVKFLIFHLQDFSHLSVSFTSNSERSSEISLYDNPVIFHDKSLNPNYRSNLSIDFSGSKIYYLLLESEFKLIKSFVFKSFLWLRLLKMIKILFVDNNFSEFKNSAAEIENKNFNNNNNNAKVKNTTHNNNTMNSNSNNENSNKNNLNKNKNKKKGQKEANYLNDFKVSGILRLTFIFFILTHISTCLWISVSNYQSDNTTLCWVNTLTFPSNKDSIDIYVASLYFNLVTIYTIGYGDIVSKNKTERIYNICLLTIGNLLFSLGISYLSFLFASFNETENKFKEKIKICEKINKKYDLPIELYKQIKKTIYTTKTNVHTEKFIIFDSLPLFLRSEMILSMHKKGISNFHFFKYSEKDFIISVLPLLKNNQLDKNDILISAGGIVEEIYLINNGIMTICLDKLFENVQISELKKNFHFGDILIHLNEKSPYLIKCHTKTCEYLTLSKSDYNKISVIYNKIIMRILEISCEFLENIERNKQIVIDLFDEGIKLVDIKNLIRSINSILINKNFYEFFYGKKDYLRMLRENEYIFTNYKINKENNQKIFHNEEELESKISVQNFIQNQDIKDIVEFSKTKMKEKDFDRIFLKKQQSMFYIKASEKNPLFRNSRESNENILINQHNNDFYNNSNNDHYLINDSDFNFYEKFQSQKNQSNYPRSSINSPKKRRTNGFKDQLLSFGHKIKSFLTFKNDEENNITINNNNPIMETLREKDEKKTSIMDTLRPVALEKEIDEKKNADLDNYENLVKQEKNIKNKLMNMFGNKMKKTFDLVNNENESKGTASPQKNISLNGQSKILLVSNNNNNNINNSSDDDYNIKKDFVDETDFFNFGNIDDNLATANSKKKKQKPTLLSNQYLKLKTNNHFNHNNSTNNDLLLLNENVCDTDNKNNKSDELFESEKSRNNIFIANKIANHKKNKHHTINEMFHPRNKESIKLQRNPQTFISMKEFQNSSTQVKNRAKSLGRFHSIKLNHKHVFVDENSNIKKINNRNKNIHNYMYVANHSNHYHSLSTNFKKQKSTYNFNSNILKNKFNMNSFNFQNYFLPENKTFLPTINKADMSMEIELKDFSKHLKTINSIVNETKQEQNNHNNTNSNNNINNDIIDSDKNSLHLSDTISKEKSEISKTNNCINNLNIENSIYFKSEADDSPNFINQNKEILNVDLKNNENKLSPNINPNKHVIHKYLSCKEGIRQGQESKESFFMSSVSLHSLNDNITDDFHINLINKHLNGSNKKNQAQATNPNHNINICNDNHKESNIESPHKVKRMNQSISISNVENNVNINDMQHKFINNTIRNNSERELNPAINNSSINNCNNEDPNEVLMNSIQTRFDNNHNYNHTVKNEKPKTSKQKVISKKLRSKRKIRYIKKPSNQIEKTINSKSSNGNKNNFPKENKFQNVNIYQIGSISNSNNFIFGKIENQNLNGENINISDNNLVEKIIQSNKPKNKKIFNIGDLRAQTNISFEILKGRFFLDHLVEENVLEKKKAVLALIGSDAKKIEYINDYSLYSNNNSNRSGEEMFKAKEIFLKEKRDFKNNNATLFEGQNQKEFREKLKHDYFHFDDRDKKIIMPPKIKSSQDVYNFSVFKKKFEEGKKRAADIDVKKDSSLLRPGPKTKNSPLLINNNKNKRNSLVNFFSSIAYEKNNYNDYAGKFQMKNDLKNAILMNQQTYKRHSVFHQNKIHNSDFIEKVHPTKLKSLLNLHFLITNGKKYEKQTDGTVLKINNNNINNKKNYNNLSEKNSKKTTPQNMAHSKTKNFIKNGHTINDRIDNIMKIIMQKFDNFEKN